MERELPLADELAVVFARMSGLLLSQETVATALELVVSSAAEVISGAAGVGVSLMDDTGRRITAAASDPVVGRLDQLQYDLDEGPCLQAMADGVVCRIDDMGTEARWPRWTALAAGAGTCATMSVPLVAGDRCLGAIKVYATEAAVLGDREENLLGLFAAQAAVLVANVKAYDDAQRFSERLTAALRDRDAVNIAKGVLMERERVDADTAFALLMSLCERDAKPLHDVAWAVLRSSRGELPERGAEVVD
ncbi:GAF and ANTAR domain-containing protein [Umezawaea sp. Da 62-37]|uniref:GAF and ANTAR domain-containing protein n=1 Tax=Umezawaea sp. Da 62-37 TaxID=3075927 RepID=UPI0028F72F1B|nr:GAF and ANTAR domain-containing protein [Umezawaea sp. Da 62-37]WNV87429.1 GAF and ANTAR domain-containing protein [Umezawaea sp. Da 62-37]